MKVRKVEKRVLPSGLITYRAPYVDAAGERRSKNFPRKADAEAFLLTVASELVQGVHTPASVSPTVAEAAKLWIAHCERQGLESTTIDGYQQNIDLHIIPFIGDIKLSALTTPAINAFTDRLHAAGRSEDKIRRVVVSLGSIFKEARRRGLAASAPTSGINSKIGHRDNPRPVTPSKAELQAIIVKAIERGLRWRAFILVAIFCGLRASELRGLAWPHVDFAEGLIHVTQRADAKHRIGKLKSKSGYRSIPMPSQVVKALREWKLKCPKGELGLVFPNSLGKVDSYLSIIEQGYAPIQIAKGITEQRVRLNKDRKPVIGEDDKPVIDTVAKYGLHALRHACASLWIEQGLNPKRIQVLMGHSSIQVTYDTYGHLFKDAEADQRAAENVQSRLLGNQ
jgi:integrase